MWTLLIFLTMASDGGVAIHEMTGYATKQQCESVAAQVMTINTQFYHNRVHTVCVEGRK